jgi:5-methylcytosine-specific restriction endonuclease McrA
MSSIATNINYQCQSCHKIDLTAKTLQVDHIIPLAQGGANYFGD